MPIIAESPPLIFGETQTPTPTPTQTPTQQPGTEPTPEPGMPSVSPFVGRHQQFLDRLSQVSPCFKRNDLLDFSDQEFTDHITLAAQDKYVTQNKDLYCSMKGIQDLTKALRRTENEQEII